MNLRWQIGQHGLYAGLTESDPDTEDGNGDERLATNFTVYVYLF